VLIARAGSKEFRITNYSLFNYSLDTLIGACYSSFRFRLPVSILWSTKCSGESHEGKIPKGTNLSLQGVYVSLGSHLILILDKAKPSVRGEVKAPVREKQQRVICIHSLQTILHPKRVLTKYYQRRYYNE
jgi:hypothetical protein